MSLSNNGQKPLMKMERVNGIEPSYAAWEAAVLPLNYTRVIASHLTVTRRQIESD